MGSGDFEDSILCRARDDLETSNKQTFLESPPKQEPDLKREEIFEEKEHPQQQHHQQQQRRRQHQQQQQQSRPRF